ncbi:MAG: aldo/keto reductase [Chloroflexi bacterium]|nr:MAG: aldo/keto reductase [Chloroflexota bacterium]
MFPTQTFGRTGHISTRTLFGAAALGDVTQADADRTLEVLLQYGVNHIDTAASYGDAELRVGPWMKKHRGDFFLATKTEERKYQGAKESIHRSLERLQTDHLDLIQLHAVIEDEEMETALGPGGALEAAVEARQQGLVRFIGITSHTLHAPIIHMHALERFDFDSVLLPLNYPLYEDPQYRAEFDALAKVCNENKVAIQTIKSICRRPWGDQKPFAACWYEPLTDQPAVDRAVAYVLAHPANVFLNTCGDIYMLPKVLAAASRFNGHAPSAESMRRMVAEYEMIPLWPEPEGMH